MTAIRVKFNLFICLLFSMGPIMSVEKDYSKEERTILNRSVNEVVDTIEKEMKEQYGLRCTGEGGSMPYDIQKIGVTFLLHQQVTIEQARKLEIRSTERFVEIINTHEAIRPYLKVKRTKVAKEGNLSRTTVQNALSKKGNPTIRTIAKIVHQAVA